MKKRINLIAKQKKYADIENFFSSLRLLTYISIAIFLVLSLGVFIFLSQKKTELDILNKDKNDLLQYVLQNKDAEAKFIYFRNKESQIKGIVQNDVNFYPYYVILNDSLGETSAAATLETLTIDKSRKSDFTISFVVYSDLISFFKFLESTEFLRNFDELSVVKFNPLEQNSGHYQLNFTGKFKKI